jgi:acetolactate synthase-1/2/3 large subunit
VRTLGVQEINIVDIVRPITKYAVTVRRPIDIRYHLEYALWAARNDRPGPVLLDIPADVQNAQVDPLPLKGFDAPKNGARQPHSEDVARVVELLRNAKRPLVHIGQGVRIAGAQHELDKMLFITSAPVVTARNGADLVDEGHPQYIGRPGTFAQRGANFAVQTCDLYIAIGTRLSLAQTGYSAQDYARNATVVMVDVDLAELEKRTVNVELGIQADAKAFLTELNWQLDRLPLPALPSWSPWLKRCKAWQEKYPPVTDEQRAQSEHVNSYALIEAISDAAGPDDVIVTDMGFAFQNTHQAWRIKAGQRLMTNCGLAPMGWGLPAAIGAAVGSGRRVIAIIGDGGMMMNVQELATLAHHKLPVKIFLLNNGGYLTMRQSQAHAFDGYMGSDKHSGLSFPDFYELAHSFGLSRARYADSSDGFYEIQKYLRFDGPLLVEVMMDPNQPQVPKSINRRMPDGTIQQTSIEDAWPYLPAEEVAENLRV